MFKNYFGDSISVAKDVIVPKSEDFESFLLEKTGAVFVLFFITDMLAAIGFDNQFFL